MKIPRRPPPGTNKPFLSWIRKALVIAFWVALWESLSLALGHGGLFLASPLETLSALARLVPTKDFWRRVAESSLRILSGFLLALAAGTILGALSSRCKAFRDIFSPIMALIRATPVASFVILALLWVRSRNLSVIVSFTHVLPVIYAGTITGLADTDRALLEMARVYRLPFLRRVRYIWLPGMASAVSESVTAAIGMCWKSGVSAEVIGLPYNTIGDALYSAKIILSTPDVFAWTAVIVLLSALATFIAGRLLKALRRRLCGEDGL